MDWAPFAYYCTPLATPDDYLSEVLDASNGIDSANHQPPSSATMRKWYDSDKDSYSSHCPKDKEYLCKRPQTIQLERKFLWRFESDSRHIPNGAVLIIKVDLEVEYNILTHARCTANLTRKAKEGQHCFILKVVKRREELEYLH